MTEFDFKAAVQGQSRQQLNLRKIEEKPITVKYKETEGRWIAYDAYRLEHPDEPYFTRQILNCELVYDFDRDEWEDNAFNCKKLVKTLKSNNIPYWSAHSGGKGLHVHAFFDRKSLDVDEALIKEAEENLVDINKTIRFAIWKKVLDWAGIDIKTAKLDTKKVQFSSMKKGSMIRDFGTPRKKNGEISYKTLIEEIPNNLPEPGELPLVFPDKPELWNVSHLSSDIETFLKSKIEQYKRSVVNINLDNVDIYEIYCINKLIKNGVSREYPVYYGAYSITRAAHDLGLSREQADALVSEYLNRCDLTADEYTTRHDNSLNGYENDPHHLSCDSIRENYDNEFCSKNCIIYQKRHPQQQNGNNDKKESQATALLKYTEQENIELFHDGTGNPYARIKLNGNFVILSVRGREFKRWITHQFYKEMGKALSNEAINSTLNIIEAKACFNGEQYTLHNRVCWHDGAVWYDLGNWKVVKITSEKLQIIDDAPILFKQYSHQKPHVFSEIVHQGDVRKILKFLNLKDEKDELLFLVYLMSCFIPDIPHTILVLHGDKGSAKSTLSKILRELIDPSILKVLTFPKDKSELIQLLDHHYFVPFDNVNHLSDWQSDILCRASTGEGFSKRELYTNDEDVIYSFQRCVGLNGINVVATKPDLLDRCILLKLDRIQKNERKTERRLWEDFERVKNEILQGIFTTLSKAITKKSQIHLDELPRMADFTEWGCAIAEALGFRKEDFLTAYYENIQVQNREALESNPVGELLLRFMEDKTEWEGTASELLNELEILAENNKINTKAKTFPKSANVLTRRLNEIKANLIEEGIEFKKSHSTYRKIMFRKISSESSEPSEQVAEATENQDDTKDGIETEPSHIPSGEKQLQETLPDDKDDSDDIFRTLQEGNDHTQEKPPNAQSRLNVIDEALRFFEQTKKESVNSNNSDVFISMVKTKYPDISSEQILQHLTHIGRLTPKIKGNGDETCIICGAPGKHQSKVAIDRNKDRIEWRCDACYVVYSTGQGVAG